MTTVPSGAVRPLLCVVIPTLGRETLLTTLHSLLSARRLDGVEVIVVGDAGQGAVAAELRALTASTPCLRHLPLTFREGDSSRKKNAGLAVATSDIVAFIDDDVCVAPNWPERVIRAFDDPAVGMLSGPSLVPEDVPPMTRLAGITLASSASGYVAYRYLKSPGGTRNVKWSHIIGCNMAFRRKVLEEVGGFDPRFWPGEEMVVSYRTERAGWRIVFEPEAYLYHYPRSSLGGFVRQIFGYGATRIRLMREGIEREWSPLLPALWVLSLAMLAIASILSSLAKSLLLLNLGLYAAFDVVVVMQKVAETHRFGDARMLGMVPVMHIAYGCGQWREILRPGRDMSLQRVK